MSKLKYYCKITKNAKNVTSKWGLTEKHLQNKICPARKVIHARHAAKSIGSQTNQKIKL